MQEKYLTKGQMQAILDSRPKGVSLDDGLKMYINNGFKIEGVNDKPQVTTAQKLGQDLTQRATNVGNQIKSIGSAEGVIETTARVAQTPLRVLGQTAGAIGDTIGAGINAVTGGGLDKVGEAVAKTAPAQKLGEALSKFREQYPDLADSIGDTLNIAGLGVGGAVAKPVAKAGIQAIESGAKATVQGVKNTVGKVTNKVKGSAITPEDQSLRALESVTPRTSELTPTEYEDLLRKQKITPRTAKGEPLYILSDQEKNIAAKYQDILQAKDPVDNSINVMTRIGNTDKEVGDFLQQNNGIFNNGELRNSLIEKLQDVTDLTIDEKRLANLKESIVNNFVKGLKKNDIESLWKARKEFDRKIESAFNGAPTLQKDIKKEFRNAIQDFIAERTPEGVYKAKMRDMRDLFELHEVIATKAAKEKNLNKINLWLKNNPSFNTVLKHALPTALGIAGYDILTQ